MSDLTTSGDTPARPADPAYLLATLFSANKSGDETLARMTADRLAGLGIRVRFGSDPTHPRPRKQKAAARG